MVQALPKDKKNQMTEDDGATQQKKAFKQSRIQYANNRTKGMVIDSDDDSDTD